MISPKCDYCSEELNDFGALLFSPPDELGKALKNHICKECYTKIKPKKQNGKTN